MTWFRIVVIILALLAPKLVNAETIIVRYDPGGNVLDRANEILALEASGADVHIIGECWSACTMLLRIACVSPRATLGFHAPSGSDQAVQIGNQIIARFYPPQIAIAYLNNWGLNRNFTILTGRQVINMGAREC